MSGAIPSLRHMPFRPVHDTFIKIILDVVLQFAVLWNCLPYVHSRSTLIVAWAEHVARIREMTYVRWFLIWNFELKRHFGTVLRFRAVDDIVMYLRVKGHRNVECIELVEFCGSNNGGNVRRSWAPCVNVSRKRLHRRRTVRCVVNIQSILQLYLQLPVTVVKRRSRFRRVSLTNPLQKWNSRCFVAAWGL